MNYGKRIAAFAAAALICGAGVARAQDNGTKELTVKSPSEVTYLKVGLNDGVPYYTAGSCADGNEVTLVEKSPLGLETNIGTYCSGLTWAGDTLQDKEISYTLVHSKASGVDVKAKELSVRLRNADGNEMSIVFIIEDYNIAFRYVLQKAGETASVRVMNEATGFSFPQKTTTFLCPQSDAGIGWRRTKPSYEEEYKADASMSERSQYGHGYTFPCLFHVGDDGWVLVSETGVDGRYCGCRLSDVVGGNTYKIEFPMEEENNGNGTGEPAFSLPGSTPWRTITLAPNLAPLVETTITWDVVEPRFSTEHDYQPGKGTWSWILWQDNSINYDDQVRFIDLAADLGFQFTLIDNYWDVNIGRERMEKLISYARTKGVGLFLWYSSSGWWNDIDQSPVNIMCDPIARKQEMRWLKEQGVKGVKVDFFGGDKQETMRLYEAILADADQFGLMVIFHGCTLPRGWERMYPNYVGSEAVLASENQIFSQHFCDSAAYNATLHPFIRNAVGSMEFGGTFLNKRLNRNNDGGTIRRTSDVFEMGTAVVFQNCIQNFALAPNNLEEQPDFEINFMRNVPTTWDEIKFIDGYPGRYVVLARRHGDDWYVAALNAQKEKLDLQLNLPMLAGKTVSFYHDGKDGSTPTKESLDVKASGKVKLPLLSNGGAVFTTAE